VRMNGLAQIRIRNLNVWYGNVHVLRSITADIPPRRITAIIGPSGCGKTTLLRCFNRLVDNDDNARVEGDVLVDGENIFAPDVDVTLIRKKMGLLSQRPFPLPMSIYDNVAYGPRIHGTAHREEIGPLVEKYLRMTNLWDEVKGRLREPAARLSVGQQQRLCLARGLAVEPEMILADEPTSALDPVSSRAIEQAFRELKDRYTVILVTHILRQARRLADYVFFMYMGELVEHGPAELIFESPRERMTREYVSGIIS